MNLFTIQWASTNLPNQRYVIFNDGKTSSIYKRFLWIIYIRVSKRCSNNEDSIKLLIKYKTLINEIQ